MITTATKKPSDIKNYTREALKGSFVIFILLLLLSLSVRNTVLWGLLVGSSLANGNVFILGFAMHELVIKKTGAWAWGGPLLFFLVIAGLALFIAWVYPELLLGFAVGLSSPLLLAAFIAYRAAQPA